MENLSITLQESPPANSTEETPITEATPTQSNRADPASPLVASTRANDALVGEGKTVLAVDDEREIARVLQISLERFGYRVIIANNGRQAVEQARAQQPDLIVMDVMMPEMNGFQALRQLKEDASTHQIPIIMLTAKDEESDVLNGWLRGADLYMTKPFDTMELIANVQRVLADNAQSDDEFFAAL